MGKEMRLVRTGESGEGGGKVGSQAEAQGCYSTEMSVSL